MTLSDSRHSETRLAIVDESRCQLHEEAFAYHGGAPSTMRLKQSQKDFIKPDIYGYGLSKHSAH
jgi:hypothetical protein